MKISYKILQRYIKNIKTPEEIAEDLIMHTAEVEKIEYEWINLKNVFVWEIIKCSKHQNSDKLNICIVEISWEEYQIVCWAKNVEVWLKVPVALEWAKLKEDFIIKKSEIRWEISNWMICSEDELWLTQVRQEWIMILPEDTETGLPIRDFLEKNDVILEIDNKAINHRPDLFSHIWVIRELFAINNEKFEFEYEDLDFSNLKSLELKNEIKDVVKRYIWLKVEWVKNIESPLYIKEMLKSQWIESKWLLIDLTNYSLYLYGQPIHCFDADKIKWKIIVRYANNWEEFLALDKKTYKLCDKDIVIADEEKVLALWWIIWWYESAVTDETENIVIEWAHFKHSILRNTWKRLWIRTDSLNIFEKDIVLEMPKKWVSLIIIELEKNIWNIKLVSYKDIYDKKDKEIHIDYDLDFINNLIWKKYKEEKAKHILENLHIKLEKDKLIVPFWRKDLENIADIAEEIARIDWYSKIEKTISSINTWAVNQDNIYKIKRNSTNFLCSRWFFDLYNYSFVNKDLMEKSNSSLDWLVSLENPLSEELSHMRNSLIPNLLQSLEKNISEIKDIKIFEIGKVFSLLKDSQIKENYEISWLVTNKNDIIYFDIQNEIICLLKNIWIYNYYFEKNWELPLYSHSWRTSSLVVMWKKVWFVWEIHPKVAKNFEIDSRIWFFSINLDLIENLAFNNLKAKEISQFQENNFDISFVVEKDIKWKDILATINKSNNLITKVELFDIYENEENIAWKRSLSFKVYLQSLEWTINDETKNKVIKDIIERVWRKWWELR